MGTFEQLLVKELQRQQHRAQFCDTVLQAQGISVPVHSCVLSAYSPRLCEFLSILPALPHGKSRVIELQAVEPYTLLRLVSTLYTGTVEGERRDLQNAANKLGITLPAEVMEGGDTECERGEEQVKDGILQKRLGSKEGDENKGTDRREYKDVGTQIDVTQTDGGRQAAEMDTQTDPDITSSLDAQFMYEKLKLVELPSALPVVDHISQFPWVTDGCFQAPASKNPLMALTDDVSASDTVLSTLDDATMCQLFSEAAIGAPNTCSSLFLPPPEDQPIETDRLHTGVHEGGGVGDGGDEGRGGGVGGGEGELVEGFEQFEGNIPEFISYFLDSAGTRRRGRRMRRSSRGAKWSEQRGGDKGKRLRGGANKGGEERQAIGKVERRFPLREGCPVELTWRGVGGGRIGRSLHLPPRKRGRPKSYNRQNSAQGKTELDQDKDSIIKKRRSRTRARPLPLLDRLPPPESGALNPDLSHIPPAPSMLHTVPLPPSAPSRSLLEQLLFELNQPSCAGQTLNGHSTQHSSKTTTPRILCPSLSAEAKSSQQQQQQPDGEASDILDHLMQSLQQSADMMPYTIIKDLQECHRRQEAKDARPQPHAHTHSAAPCQKAPQPTTHTSLSHPQYRRHCKPTDRRAKGGTGKKMILEEISLSAEMFEERRMTRNQAKRLRTSSANAWATRSTAQDNPAPKRPQQGKNMKTLRQKLLGKRKRDEDEEEKEEEIAQGTESFKKTSPSSSKEPKLSPEGTPRFQPTGQAQGSD